MFSSTSSNKVPAASASFKLLNSFEDFDESTYEKMHETLKLLLSVRNTPLSTTSPSSGLDGPQSAFKDKFTVRIDYPTVDTLILELQSTLAKLESEIFRSNDTRMEAFLESSIFAPLTEDSNLDQVIGALLSLDAFLTGQSCYAFRPVLKRNVNRIVLLCAGQFCVAASTYMTGVEKNKKKEDEQVKRVQKFINSITQLLQNLLVKNAMNLSCEISRDSLAKLMYSLIPFFAYSSIYGASTEVNRCKPISMYGIYMLFSNIFKPEVTSGQSSVQAKLITIILRMLRDFTVDSLKDAKQSKQINQSIDLLAKLIRNHSHNWNYVHAYFKSNNTKDLGSVVYEIYALFELYSRLSNAFLHNNSMQAIESLKSYICSLFKELGPAEAWKHFEMVDKEIAVGKFRSEEVALFKFLAGRGFTRSPSEKTVEKRVQVWFPQVFPVASNKIQMVHSSPEVWKPMEPKTVSGPVEAKLVAVAPTPFSSRESIVSFMRLANYTTSAHKTCTARTTKPTLLNSSKESTPKASSPIEPSSKPIKTQKKPFEFPKELVELQKKLDELQKKPFEVQGELIKTPKNSADPLHLSELDFAKAFAGLISTVPTVLAEPIHSTSIEVSTTKVTNPIEPSKLEALVEHFDANEPDVVILDVADDEVQTEVPDLIPSKVTEAFAELSGEQLIAVDEASFEIIDEAVKVPEVSDPKIVDTKESQAEPVVETSSSSKLLDKEALLNQVKQMYADILKTQESIDKLMQKFASKKCI